MKFAERVYGVTKQIPRGKVSTYKAVADAIGTKGYRAVGQALHTNPHAPKVPCHRVVASDGSIGGFALGTKKKILMLKREGVNIHNKNIDLQKYFVRLKKEKGREVP